MEDLYVECVNLYRTLVPNPVRDAVGRLRSRQPQRTPRTQAAHVSEWRAQNYSKARWEHEYRTDKWRYMRELEELSRYSVIVGYARHLRPHGSVLDLGCGEGILQQRLGPENYKQYLGLDISQHAIDRARTRTDASTTFVCGAVEEYAPAQRFDVIVWNELLYYLHDPLAVLERYHQYLEPGGIFVVSMLVDGDTNRNWSLLERSYEFLDETMAGNVKTGFSWSCRVARPGR